jgi:hypothetical protein
MIQAPHPDGRESPLYDPAGEKITGVTENRGKAGRISGNTIKKWKK